MTTPQCPAHGLVEFPPRRENPLEIPDLHAQARACPGLARVNLTWSGTDVALVSRYDDVREVLESEHASVDYRLPNFPNAVPHRAYRPEHDPIPFIQLDPPRHSEFRRLVMGELAFKKVRALHPLVQEIVDRALDEFIAGGNPGELVLDYAFKIPGAVICSMYGVPQEDAPRLEELSRRVLYPDAQGNNDLAALQEFAGYLAAHLRENRDASPIVQSLNAALDRGELTFEEMVTTANTVFAGGFETTVSGIGAAVFELLRRPEAASYIREADEQQLMVAADELIRYTAVDHIGIGRIALEDIPLSDGAVVPKDERLMVSLSSANRDESVFERADELDLKRVKNPHVTFGHGVHQCPGQHVARLEIAIAVQSLFRRLPNLRLAVEPEAVPFRDNHEVRGPIEMPVAW